MSTRSASIALPETNDLVRVTLGVPDDPDAEPLTSDVPSRVEGVRRDPASGEVLEYEIAAPFFSGDLEPPGPGVTFMLQWLTPRGVCRLPVAFREQHTVHGLRVWRAVVAGPVRREERRRFVRVPWSLPTQLLVRRDLDALTPERRRLADVGGVRSALPGLPDAVPASTCNLSEGGLLCISDGDPLPLHLPLVARFAVAERSFEIDAYVVWSVAGEQRGTASSALLFDDVRGQGEVLRPLLFRAQLDARRAGLV